MTEIQDRMKIWWELDDPAEYPGGKAAWQAEVNRRWAERQRVEQTKPSQDAAAQE